MTEVPKTEEFGMSDVTIKITNNYLLTGTGTTLAKHSSCTALLWLYRELNFVKELLLAVASATSQSDMAPL